ncbi:MAG: hypothetical protein NTX03_01705 [Bacteroidetes bacterium]|nr:hypothetical protein [Bacteroidota bacterium]
MGDSIIGSFVKYGTALHPNILCLIITSGTVTPTITILGISILVMGTFAPSFLGIIFLDDATGSTGLPLVVWAFAFGVKKQRLQKNKAINNSVFIFWY